MPTELCVNSVHGDYHIYKIGPDSEYRMWTIRSFDLVLSRHDGTRTHIPAGVIHSIDVSPGGRS